MPTNNQINKYFYKKKKEGGGIRGMGERGDVMLTNL